VDRAARRLARTTFHAMLRFGPRLEQRQMVLFRLVDVGAELFAMTAACARAELLRSRGDADAIELADVFCRHARRRVGTSFDAVFDNEDVATYGLARRVLGEPTADSR
jgi:hypothetical protein